MSHRRRTAFTLIELLVVIAIIAILAAILFPVFAKAREKARQASCMSNLKELGMACHMYTEDYDERMPFRWDWNIYTTSPPGPGTWPMVLDPYIKNLGIWTCPSAAKGAKMATLDGSNDWWNNYAHNDHFIIYYAQQYGGWDRTNSYNKGGAKLSAFTNPSETIHWLDASPDHFGGRDPYTSVPWAFYHCNWHPYGDCGRDARHPGESENVLWCDGHVKTHRDREIAGTPELRNKYWYVHKF